VFELLAANEISKAQLREQKRMIRPRFTRARAGRARINLVENHQTTDAVRSSAHQLISCDHHFDLMKAPMD